MVCMLLHYLLPKYMQLIACAPKPIWATFLKRFATSAVGHLKYGVTAVMSGYHHKQRDYHLYQWLSGKK